MPSSPELSIWRISTWKGEPKRMEKRYQDNQVPTRASSRGNLYCIKPSLFLSPELRHFRGQSLQPGNSIGRETLKITVLLFLIFPFCLWLYQNILWCKYQRKWSTPRQRWILNSYIPWNRREDFPLSDTTVQPILGKCNCIITLSFEVTFYNFVDQLHGASLVTTSLTFQYKIWFCSFQWLQCFGRILQIQ